MAGFKGSKILIKKAAAVICAGITSRSLKINGEVIDVTSDDDLGWRGLLQEIGAQSVDVSFEGVMKDSVLVDISKNGTQYMTDVTVQVGTLVLFTGNFVLSSLSIDGETNDAVKFSAELQSSGVVVLSVPS